MKADIVILTPIAPEYEAVLAHLQDIKDVNELSYLCQLGIFQGKTTSFTVAVCQTSSGNVPVAKAAIACIHFFQPDYIFLTGTSGGIKKFNIGDIIIGETGYDYETGKEYDEGFKARPKVAHSDKKLVALAQVVGQKDDWKNRIKIKYPINTNNIKIKTGAIASGSKIVATLKSNVLEVIKTHYNYTVAIEMEAYGFLDTLADYLNIAAINIRSISDLLSDKQTANLNHSKEIASANAAAFTFEVIANLEKKNSAKILNIRKSFRWTLLILVPILLSFFVYKKWFVAESSSTNQHTQIDSEIIPEIEIPKDTVVKIEEVQPATVNKKRNIPSTPQKIVSVDTPNTSSIPIEEKTKEELFEVKIFPDIEAVQYIIKDENNTIVKKSQGYKTYNFQKGSYTITFYHKQDTANYFMNIPDEKTVILSFN
jgi:nucleoside phosphorylase